MKVTWIIKQVDEDVGDCCYQSAPGEGSAWGPTLDDAYRFASKAAAEREIRRLGIEHRRADWKFVARRVVKPSADDHYMLGWNDAVKAMSRKFDEHVRALASTHTKGSVR